jgi:hypothetical protein
LSLEQLGDAALIVGVVFSTAFIIGYSMLVPWYKSEIGRSLFLSKTWICCIVWMSFLRTTLEVPLDNGAILVLRTAIWVGLPIITIYTFWALLVNGQIRRFRRRSHE